MKIHVLERALTAACIVAAIAVVWWGFKILAAWTTAASSGPATSGGTPLPKRRVRRSFRKPIC